jgi:putative copper export protein/mono/diheme cytochrome c family protein
MPAAIPLLRGALLLCLVSLLGTLTARLAVAPGFAAGRRPLVRLARVSLALAVPCLLLWLLVQAASFAGTDAAAAGPAATLAVLPAVMRDTRFGHVMLVRLLLLVAAWPLLDRGRLATAGAAVLAAAALALQAALGHAGAVGGGAGAVLLAVESLHLLAAGAWLGGLLPLLILTVALPAPMAARAAQRFTAVGLPAVLVLVCTAIVQGDALIGGLPGLFGTAYGHIVLLKLALFAVLLAIALVNRFVLTARFERGAAARRGFVVAVAIEAAAGVAVVMAAALLATQVPGEHAQPVWPFALRPSAAALADPDIAREVMLALAGCAAGLMLVAAGLLWRRLRIALLVAGAVLAGLSIPHLRPLLVDAYPTSFYRSPSGFAAASIVRGAAVFAANCVACHGATGRGDGPAAAGQAVPPADLTAAHLWEHSDGELFWWLTHGMDNPEGGLSMPGFGTLLSADDRWAAIDFIRANNAGAAFAATGAWPVPVAAPAMPLLCAGVGDTDMAALRGRLVQVLAGVKPPLAVAPGGIALESVDLAPDPGADHVGKGCRAATPDAWPAYAILTGGAPLAGMAILVDRSGWLRAAFRPGAGPGALGPDAAATETTLLDAIIRQPLAAATGDSHGHHH